jgi:hypothetical protein
MIADTYRDTGVTSYEFPEVVNSSIRPFIHSSIWCRISLSSLAGISLSRDGHCPVYVQTFSALFLLVSD